jgi:hypothetical protein
MKIDVSDFSNREVYKMCFDVLDSVYDDTGESGVFVVVCENGYEIAVPRGVI